MSPKVSVIIPTIKGREKLLEKAIESVLKQTFQDFEIIVVSNCELSVSFTDLRIKIIVAPEANVSAARNIGIVNAKGRYIAFLDDDDEWLPEKLKKQLELFKKDPELGLVHTLYAQRTPDGKLVPNMAKVRDGYVYCELMKGNFIGTSTVMIKREVVDSVGLFDENLTFAEDWDYWIRISQKYKIGHVPEILVIYSLSPITKYRDSFRKFCLFFKSGKIYFQKVRNHALILLWYLKIGKCIGFFTYWITKLALLLNVISPAYVIDKYCDNIPGGGSCEKNRD